PFAGVPDETRFEGMAKLRAISMVRVDGAPIPPTATLPVARDIPRPSELEWQLPKDWPDEAKFSKLPDGGGDLSGKGKKTDQQASAAVALSTAAPSEIVFELDKATPGGGIFFGEHGQPRVLLNFLYAKPNRMLLKLQGADESNLEGENKLTET